MTTLHTLRRTARLSLSELASLSGVGMRRLADYEYGGAPFDEDDRWKLATYFGIHPLVLTDSDDEPAPPPHGRPRQLGAALIAIAALSSAGWLGWHTVTAASAPLPTATAAPAPLSVAAAPSSTVPPTAQASSTVAEATALPSRTAAPAAQSSSTVVATTLVPSSTAAPTIQPTATEPPLVVPSLADLARPSRCPLISTNGTVVVTLGYGVGSHAPAATVGAVDLAIDSDGDGLAEPAATRGALVVAAHAGTVTVQRDTWPAGNHVWVTAADGWRTGYSHLARIDAADGQTIYPGQVLGLVGQTGQAAGPHLDFQVWHNDINQDPSEEVLCAAHNHPPLQP